MKTKALFAIPAAIIAVLAPAAIADAHNATATGTCEQGVTWSATQYDKTVINKITVTIDGVVVHQDLDFKASDSGVWPTDKTVPHTWSVVVDAPGTQFDKSPKGSYPACVAVTTTTLPSSTTVVVTTPTVPATSVPPPVATTVVTSTTCDTTVTAGSCFPPVPTTVAAPPSTVLTDVVVVEPSLPRTGLDAGIVGLAFVLVAVGALLVVRGRREG